MRVIEKLAREATDENDPCSPDYYQGFLEGFRSARELAAQLLAPFTIRTGWEGRMQMPGYGVTSGETEERPLSDIIRRLGEEDLK